VFTGGGAEAGATVTLFDTNGTTVLGTGLADASGNWSITSSTLAAGNHTLTARQADIAGNTSVASAGLAITIDTAAAAPSAPDMTAATDTGTSQTDNITSNTTPVFTGGGAEAGATVTLFDTNGTTVLGTGLADASGNWSITSSTLAAGNHTLTARQADIAGNTSVASAGLAITIDTAAAAPSAPDMTAATDTGTSQTDNITSNTTPVFTGGGAEAGATVTLFDTNGTTVLGTGLADASGNWSITSSTLAAGNHTLTARQADIAGNTSVASAGLAITIDTAAAAPSAPDMTAATDTGTSQTDNITSNTTPVFTGGGAEAGATVTLFDTNGTTVLGTGLADASGNWSITSSTLAAGNHTLTARQADIAGNTSVASAGLAITIDTAAAAPSAPDMTAATDTGTSQTDNITSNTTPVFTGGGAEAGATVTLFDTNGTTVLGTGLADASGNWSITSSTLAAGNHTLTARQADIAGNTSVASAGLAITIDTAAAAPSAPDMTAATDTGTSQTDNITSNTTPVFTGGGAEAGATVTLFDTNGTTVLGTGLADASGNWSITSSTLAAGNHTLTARQADIAGNTSVASAGLAITIDTAAAAPSAPDMTAATDTGTSQTDNITSNTTPVFTGGGAEAGATVTLFDTNGTTVLGTGLADASGNWSITSSTLAAGNHTLTARQADIAGNTSVASAGLAITIDTAAAAPSAPDMTAATDTGTSQTDNITSNTTPVFTGGGAEAGATVTLFDTNGTTVLGTGLADASGNWSITSSTLAAGNHTLTARQADIAGNTSVASAGLAITIDTAAAAPSAPDMTAATDTGTSQTDNITSNTTPVFTGGGAEAGATVTLFDTNGTTVLGTGLADASGNWSITSSTLAAGNHTLTARQADIAGNTSVASAGLAITIDTAAAAPSAPDMTAATDTGTSQTDNITSNTTPVFTGGGAEAGATVTLFDTNGTTVLGTGLADASGNWSITSSTLAAGNHTLTARQADIAGNTSVASAGLAITIDTAAAAPSAPDMTAATDTGTSQTDNITSNTTPVFTGGGAEAGATVTLFDTNGTTVLGTGLADASGNWSITSSTLAAGNHTLTARQADIAGNTSVASAGLAITIDTAAAAPSAPDMTAATDTGTSQTDNITSNTTPVFTGGGAEAGATVTLFDTNGTTVLGTGLADASGNWSITSSTLAAGNHTLTARQADIAGNTSVASAGLAITIDTAAAAPSAPDMTAATDTGTSQTDNITSNTTPVFTGGGAEAGATVTLFDTNGTTVLGTGLADASGNWSIASSTLAASGHTLTARQTDIAGNTSVASAGLAITIDTAAAAPSAPDMTAATDTGTSQTDN